MTIKSTLGNTNYSTDPTASNVGRFLVRLDTMTTSERREPASTTRALSLEELYPSLFEEPRLFIVSDASAAALDALTSVIRLLRRRVLRLRVTR